MYKRMIRDRGGMKIVDECIMNHGLHRAIMMSEGFPKIMSLVV